MECWKYRLALGGTQFTHAASVFLILNHLFCWVWGPTVGCHVTPNKIGCTDIVNWTVQDLIM